MKTVVKPVYYCEYCGKKGLVARHILAHERGCCSNPARKCALCDLLGTSNDLPALVAKYRSLISKGDYGENSLGIFVQLDLGADLKQGNRNTICPNCKLAVLRQIGVKCYATGWDYKEALGLAFAEIRENDYKPYG